MSRSTPRATPRVDESSSADGPFVVLVVEPDRALAKTVAKALTRAGYRALTELSGERAIAVVRSERVDALVLELRIPDMRGDVVFELASSHQPRLRNATVFATGDTSEAAQKLIDACGCPVVRKPYVLADVLEAVARTAPTGK